MREKMTKKGNNQDIARIALTIAIICLGIGLVTAVPPTQPYTLYGTATLNGKVLTAQDDDVIALKVEGVELVSYTMGDIAGTDNYVLKVPMDSDSSVTTAAQEGDSAYIYINGVEINEGVQVIGAPAAVVQVDISAASENIPPVASFTYSPLNPIVDQNVTFDLSSSYDPDGQIVDYYLSFGYGPTARGALPTAEHSFIYAGSYAVTLIVTDDGGATNITGNGVTVASQGGNDFETRQSENPYPSIPGTHTGTITPSQNITVQKLYTYPCAGTGGHTESVRIYGNGKDESSSKTGYGEDGDTITFDSSFTLEAGKTYNYVIETGSYPQIHHTKELQTENGWLNCTKFTDANGKEYDDWIPAIQLFG